MTDRAIVALVRVAGSTGAAFAVIGSALLITMGRSDLWLEDFGAFFALFAVFLAVFTWLAVPAQPGNAVVWTMAAATFLSGVYLIGLGIALRIIGDPSPAHVSAVVPADLPATASWLLVVAVPGGTVAGFTWFTFGLLLFPDGDLPSRRWRWVAWLSAAGLIFLGLVLGFAYRPGSTAAADEDQLKEIALRLVLVCGILSVLSLVNRFRLSSGETRQQFKWIVWSSLMLVPVMSLVVLARSAYPTLIPLVALAALVVLLTSYGIAVGRYRLYDIDVVISRTFVYGTLAVLIGAVYVLVVVVLGGLIGSEAGSLALQVAATALVAVVFEPARRRAQSWANRLVYGKRATPYEVLSRLTRRLAGAEPSEGILTRMARLMAEGTGAEQASVWLAAPDGLAAAAGWPELPTPDRAQPIDDLNGFQSAVLHDDQLVGVLEVVKTPGNPVTPTEEQLIADLAGSAGLVLGNQRLNSALAARATELQESRRRLVEIQDDERRRLERDLHDGAQQQVVALKLKIGIAQHLAKREEREGLAEDLGELAEEAQIAVDEIRTLAKGIFPPLLESDDLAGAIRALAAASPVPVEVMGDGIGHYPTDVESALYFAALEAMANAERHGMASKVRIVLGSVDGGVEVAVTDDGTGFDVDHAREGPGLTGIRDRIEALGGELRLDSEPGIGTTVRVRIPLDEPEGSPPPDSRELDPVGATGG